MHVVVTRPQEQARAWLDALAQAGHTPHALPLIDIAALAGPAEQDALASARSRVAQFQALMFVSSSAVAHFVGQNGALALMEYAQTAIKTRAWATGPGTVKALQDAGWPAGQIDSPPPGPLDSEALWRQVRHQVAPGGRVLVVRGAGGGRDWLTLQLEADGVLVEHCDAYERRRPAWTAAQMQQARSLAGPHAAWLFSSSEGVRNLGVLMPQQDWSQTRAIATHARIAQAAQALGFAVAAPSRPTLPEVLASIESLA